jgi:hypothetical protein
MSYKTNIILVSYVQDVKLPRTHVKTLYLVFTDISAVSAGEFRRARWALLSFCDYKSCKIYRPHLNLLLGGHMCPRLSVVMCLVSATWGGPWGTMMYGIVGITERTALPSPSRFGKQYFPSIDVFPFISSFYGHQYWGLWICDFYCLYGYELVFIGMTNVVN